MTEPPITVAVLESFTTPGWPYFFALALRESRVRGPSARKAGRRVGVEGQECAGNPMANSSGLAVGAAAVDGDLGPSYLSAKPATTNGGQRWCARIRLENSFRHGRR